MKLCSRCNTKKPRSSFDLDKRRSDGLYSWCKDCARAYHKDRRRKQKNSPTVTGMKTCSKCRTKKPVEQFSTNSANADGRYNYCKTCAASARRKRYRKDPNYFKSLASKRKAKVRGAQVEPVSRRRVWERDAGICQLCGDPVPFDEMHLDHVVPVSKDGKHSYDNTQTSHATCNLEKFNKLEAVA